MTIGGLALVLGRVLDDSIVDVENTIRHLGLNRTPFQAALDSAQEIALPVLMATITTVVVFLPLVFMEGVGKYLFTPLAVSATLAMFASYFVSRTVSPLLCAKLLRPHGENESFPWRLFAVALAVAGVGLTVWLLADKLALAFVGRRLPLSPRIYRWLYLVILAVGIGAGVLVALAPVMALFHWLNPRFNRLYEGLASVFEKALRFCLRWRLAVVLLLVAVLLPAVWAFLHTGQELFPEVDNSEFTVHMRATGGPRVEETERQVSEMEDIIRQVIPEQDREMILANVGISSRWSAVYTPNNGPHAAFVRVQLRSGFDGRRTPTRDYVEELRQRFKDRFPGNDFFFETSGMIRQILNAGAVAPIEVQVYGRDTDFRRAIARELDRRIAHLPGVLDTYEPQGMDLPQLKVNVNRTKAALLGFTEADIIRNVITALMSSAQIAPNFWIDPETGNPYIIGVQYPEQIVEDIQTLENIPITSERGRSGMRATSDMARGRYDPASGTTARLLKDVARIERTQGAVEVYHQSVQRVSQLFINVGANDLAGVAAAVQRVVDHYPLEYAMKNLPGDHRHLADNSKFQRHLELYFRNDQKPLRTLIQNQYGVDPDTLKLPKGVRAEVRGEVSSMRHSFGEMLFVLVLAGALIYLVMAAQFSSWLDPLIMIMAAPLGLIGVAFILWATDTSLNIQSFMGVLMMVGISVSNSVLLVEFANRQRASGMRTLEAVVSAARIRLRPILMTTLATIVCLLPMAIHFRPGDEMNVPLARAVIGGLTASTVLTLFVVPVLYVLLKPKGSAVPPPEPATV
jgi:multidrug efflux pump subunit AcrB